MDDVVKYIKDTLGLEMEILRFPKRKLDDIPAYITGTFDFVGARLYGKEFYLAYPKENIDTKVKQLENHFDRLWAALGMVVLVLPDISIRTRQTLIEKKINFIVPGKQLFLPELLIDLREEFITKQLRRNNDKLLPSAQLIILYHLLYNKQNDWRIAEHSFKEVAGRLGYTPAAISKAVESLVQLEIASVVGDKEKYIDFHLHGIELWNDIDKRRLWTNPVLKRMYLPLRPKVFRFRSGETALAEYSDMNPSRMHYYAVGKDEFYQLKLNFEFEENPDYDSEVCLEVWKYDPKILANGLNMDLPVVDPLSLYLSLRDTHDERVEMALDNILEEHIIW
ncbi:hypothetical protein [Pedobacter sp. V48]|uniref:hypothetical protein n=1 Tax=Pedobacter sp. V48 TaxID=509635 RepID=UPI0003E46D6A|nr:hypothetical protein [Pedobacter sp. V48]ETZ24318.1 hypothetical protein N824_14310 [Pedobacter sp. V48]